MLYHTTLIIQSPELPLHRQTTCWELKVRLKMMTFQGPTSVYKSRCLFFPHFTPLLINLTWVLTSFRTIMATYLVSLFHNLSLHNYNKPTWTILELKKCWPLPVFLHNTPVLWVKNYWCILYNVKYRSERTRLVQALSEELTFLFYIKVASCWRFRSVKVLSCKALDTDIKNNWDFTIIPPQMLIGSCSCRSNLSWSLFENWL